MREGTFFWTSERNAVVLPGRPSGHREQTLDSIFRNLSEQEILIEYRKDLYTRSRRWGGWAALLGGTMAAAFLYLDFTIIKIPELIPYRFVSIVPALLFGILLYSVRDFSRRNYRWLRVAHWFLLACFMSTGYGVITETNMRPETVNGLIFISVGVFFLSVGGAIFTATVYAAPMLPALLYVYVFLQPDRMAWADLFNAIFIMIGGVVLSGVQERYAFSRFRSDQLANFEKKKSDYLISSMFPPSVAEELRRTGTVQPVEYKSATVLFADFTNFTSMAARLDPDHLLKELDYCFSAFDRIVTSHGLQKIKTIGDAYMCAGGLPLPSSTHTRDSVLAALEMVEWIQSRKQEMEAGPGSYWNVRVGIHSGPVIAGIVGERGLSYDIWGDTVNMASRLEHAGEPGRLNVSREVMQSVEGEFHFTSRGWQPVKGKGDVEMFFVENK